MGEKHILYVSVFFMAMLYSQITYAQSANPLRGDWVGWTIEANAKKAKKEAEEKERAAKGDAAAAKADAVGKIKIQNRLNNLMDGHEEHQYNIDRTNPYDMNFEQRQRLGGDYSRTRISMQSSKNDLGREQVQMSGMLNNITHVNQITKDVKDFIKQHLINDYQHPFSEWAFCQEMMEKVCSYYHIDKQKLLMGLCEPEIRDAVIRRLNSYTQTANEQMKALLDRWKTRRNVPQWSILQNGRSSKQMLSLVNIMTICNKNNLPVPIASDNNYLYYSLDNTQKIARIERNSSKLEITDGNTGYILQQSLSNYALSNESKSPTSEIALAFKQKRNLRRYDILEDGSGKAKYTDELNKTINYTIKAPVLHYMSDSSIVVYNAFSQTEKTPTIRKDEDKVSWGYKFAFKNMNFRPKYDILTKDNDERVSKGKISGEINFGGLSMSASEDSQGGVSKSVNLGGKTDLKNGELSVSMSEDSQGGVSKNVNIGWKTDLINSELSISNNSKGETSVDLTGGVSKYGTGISVSGGIAVNEKENGSLDREARGSINLSLLGVVSREYNVSFSDNYLRINESSNVGCRQLPSSIQNALLIELFAEDENKILFFTDKFTSDEYNQRMPMTKSDFQNIRNKALREINNMNIPDYQNTPSDFNSFESCLEEKQDFKQ